MPNIDFPVVRRYLGTPPHAEPKVAVKLSRIDRSERHIRTLALVDSGADHCLFQRDLGERLGLDLDDLPLVEGQTAGGRIDVPVCHLRLEMLGQVFECLVGFLDEKTLPNNLLGRQGIFDQIQLGFRESRLEFYFRWEP